MPRYHPACLLFPQLGPQELQELADDIKVNGLRHPIVLHAGKVLDGPQSFGGVQNRQSQATVREVVRERLSR